MERLDPQSVASIVARLAQENGFLETVFDALDEGVVVLDDAQKLLYLNRAARELLGLPPATGPGNSLRRHLPDLFWKSLGKNGDAINPDAVVHQDVKISYPRRRLLRIYVTSLQSNVSPSPEILLILRDITEARNQEARDAESERLSAVTTLAAGVAHEIGNPLNSLHIYLQLLERDLRTLDPASREKLERHVRICQGEIARLDRIVSQFLKAVRPTNPTLEPCSANAILEEMLEVLGPEITNRNLLVEKELKPDLPSILADRNQIKQAFFNIIRNSLQAMTKNGILYLRTELMDDGVLFTFRDTGGGISPEALQRIFEPYFTTKHEGSGLGLMIVERIIRDHNGRIEVSSEKGRGTAFRVYLPVAERRVRLLESESAA